MILFSQTMNPFAFKTLAEFLAYFQDEETCVKHFAEIRFRKGEYCPHCGHTSIYQFRNGKRYRCKKCKQDFTIKTRTVFGESKLPIKKWYIAIYLLATSGKGISSIQLAKQIGVTQKTAWFMDHRIRSTMKQNNGQLFGTIEVDETYVGGLEKNKHLNKRTKGTKGRSTQSKSPIIGLIQRGGEIRATVSEDVKMTSIESQIVTHAKIGSKIITDDFSAYSKVSRLFAHETVSHGKGEYARESEIHTNTIESFWAIFKRGYKGIYHYMSHQHLQRYVDEYVFRYNRRAESMQPVFSDVVELVSKSEHLSYNELTEKAGA
jgi:transposase-like protein